MQSKEEKRLKNYEYYNNHKHEKVFIENRKRAMKKYMDKPGSKQKNRDNASRHYYENKDTEDYKKRNAKASRKYYRKNKKTINDKSRKKSQENREARRLSYKKWYDKNKDKPEYKKSNRLKLRITDLKIENRSTLRHERKAKLIKLP